MNLINFLKENPDTRKIFGKRELKIIISVPKDMEYGNYSGKMRIFIYKL